MRSKTISPAAYYRPTWAEIDSHAFVDNVRHLSARLSGRQRLIVVLKADGYGHGAVPLARALAAARIPTVWGFGVSSVEEGLALRQAECRERILILGSLYPFESFMPALKNKLTPTVASLAAAKALAAVAARLKLKIPVHLKIDTGMSRIGVSPDTAMQAVDEILRSGSLTLEGVYTHFACADDPAATRRQMALFEKILAELKSRKMSVMAHAANSQALLEIPGSLYDAARPGIALYGVPPSGQSAAGLAPVLSWKTRIVFVKSVKAGTRISYGGTFQARRPSRIATLPVGYADGYRRAFSNRGRALVRGAACPVVGRVTMDQTLLDVTDVPGVDVGEEAVLLGRQGGATITADDLAGWADTISYEILCGISARVPRVEAKNSKKS